MQPDPTLIARVLRDAGADASVEVVGKLGVVARVEAQDAVRSLEALKTSSHAYHFMVDLFGVDTGEDVDVVYHLRSFACDEELHVKARHEYGATLRSVWELFPAALMAERECAEMFGLLLWGHPNPKRLLTTEQVPALLLKSVAIRDAEEVRDR